MAGTSILRRSDRVALEMVVTVKRYGSTARCKAKLSDLSEVGCRLHAEEELRTGTRVLIRLPGREFWAATVIWRRGGFAGAEFERVLHPAEVEKYARYFAPVASALRATG